MWWKLTGQLSLQCDQAAACLTVDALTSTQLPILSPKPRSQLETAQKLHEIILLPRVLAHKRVAGGGGWAENSWHEIRRH